MCKAQLTTSQEADERDFRIGFTLKEENFCKELPILTHLPTAA